MMLGLSLSTSSMAVLNGGGGAPAEAEYWIIPVLHQSNMTGGQTNALSATLLSPDDDALTDLFEWSPNGGGAYSAGGADPTPSFARMLNAAATAQLRFPQGTAGTTYPRTERGVGPAWSFMKAAKTAYPNRKFVAIPIGVGGTSISEYHPAAGAPSNWPANRYNVFKTAYDAFKVAYPNSEIFAFLSSFLENEMANSLGLSAVSTGGVTFIDGFRAIGGAGADTAPFVFSSPLVEWLQNDTTKRGYLLAGAKLAVTQPNVGFTRRPRGYSVGGDTIHMNNAGNRIHGPQMYTTRGLTVSLNAAPPAAPVVSLTGETLSITANGAAYYDIFVRTPSGSGPYTKYEFVPQEYNGVGEVLKTTLPLSGDRDVYVVAKAYAGDSAASTVLTYTVPTLSVPTPIIKLDFDNAVMSGTDMVTVPSSGSDVTDWIPTSTAGTGATAAMKRQLLGSKYVAVLDATTKRFSRGGAYVFPAGDYTVVAPMQIGSATAGGNLVGAGQATNPDIQIAVGSNSGLNARVSHNTGSVQLLSTNGPTGIVTTLWVFFAIVYNRTANTISFYYNDEVVTLPGTLVQRSASPANSGGTSFYGNGIASTAQGWSGSTLGMPPQEFSAALSFDQLQKLKAQYRTDHGGVAFGYVPPAA
jgi:hypothetical protein